MNVYHKIPKFNLVESVPLTPGEVISDVPFRG